MFEEGDSFVALCLFVAHLLFKLVVQFLFLCQLLLQGCRISLTDHLGDELCRLVEATRVED